MNAREKRSRRYRFWRQLPLHAALLFYAGVFCLFASFGFIGVNSRQSFTDSLIAAVLSGAIATVFAVLGTRGYMRGLWVAAAIMLGFLVYQSHNPPAVSGGGNGPAANAAILTIIGGYLLMLLFIGTEGRRYYRLHTEVALAGEIHRALAPDVARRIGEWEFAGCSRPSGEVGGDLVDVVGNHTQGWLAYVADVSGHGVAAGVLMGVVKSAVHTAMRAPAPERALMAEVNQVLVELLPPEKFVTFAALFRIGADGPIGFLAAGQPPLLHYHAAERRVSRLAVENFPLGLFPADSFAAASLECAPGDVLALITDGCTEVFNAQGAEFGLEGAERALARSADQPLDQAAAALVAAVQSFGPQTDDQTVLLVRRTS